MTQTLIERRAMAERRQADFEAYEWWRLRRDELTDASERISAPIDSEFSYLLDPERGLVSTVNESLKDVLIKGRTMAATKARENSDWLVELERRRLEIEEYQDTEQLARTGHGARVRFWLVPDAVRAGLSTLDGYSRDRLKMFVRISRATAPGEVTIRSLSLDGSDYQGVQAMVATLGYSLPTGVGSEMIASMSFAVDGQQLAQLDAVQPLGEQSKTTGLADMLRTAYDDTLAVREGGQCYGGRQALSVKNALEFIEQQDDLIADHMAIVVRHRAAAAGNKVTYDGLMTSPRYNFAAALEDRLLGKTVESLEASGDAARSEGKSFEGDCPTGTLSVSQQAEQLGFGVNRYKTGACPVCGAWVTYEVCAPVCSACGASGKDLRPKFGPKASQQPLKQLKRKPRTVAKSIGQQMQRQREIAARQKMRIEKELVVGGTVLYAIDPTTGQRQRLS